MGTIELVGDVDKVGLSELQTLTRRCPGPCVSILMPTHRAGPDVQQDPIRLSGLVDDAAGRLLATGLDRRTIDQTLEVPRGLLDDPLFWRNQAGGLAIYTRPDGFNRHFRLPFALRDDVVVGPTFRVRPLLPMFNTHGHWYLLAIAQNQVRLFCATPSSITEMELGSIPGSLAEALAHEDPERQMQQHSAGAGTTHFHGHGGGAELDKEAIGRFLRAVDRGLVSRLRGDRGPVVLAAVGYYVPIYRSVSRLPNLAADAVTGNPEHLDAAELHRASWSIAEPHVADRRAHVLDRLHHAPPRAVVSGLGEVITAACEGRVDTLFVTDQPAIWGHVEERCGEVKTSVVGGPDSEDLIDRAVADTIRASGQAFEVDQDEVDGRSVVALLRY